MFESLFWGAALLILIGAVTLVAIGAIRQPRPRKGQADPRRTFGRKRRWRRAAGAGRRSGVLPLR
jgi:cell division septation protein DedD